MVDKIEIAIIAVDLASNVISTVTGKIKSALGSVVAVAATMGAALLTAFTAASVAAAVFLKDSILAAGRVEELAIINQVLAKNAGLSSQAVISAAAAVKSMGIESAIAQTVVAKFVQNQLDLTKAANLARIAQDAAVISGQNSTQALDGLLQGIITLQPEVLRTYGLFVDTALAYKEFAKAAGISTAAMTTQQKQQAILNAVMEQGKKITGAYQAAMESASKQIRSWPRLLDDIMVAIGTPFQDAFDNAAFAVTTLLKTIVPMMQEGGLFYPILLRMAAAAEIMATQFGKLIKGIDWGALAVFLNKVGNAIEQLYKNISIGNWQGVFDQFLSGFTGLGDRIAEAIDDVDWNTVGTSIADGIRGIDWQGNSEKFTATIAKIGAALLAAAKEFPWGDVGAAIGDAIMSSIAGAMTVNGKQANWQEIKDQMQANAEAFPGWSEIGNYIGQEISNGISFDDVTFDPTVWVTAFDQIKMIVLRSMAGIQDALYNASNNMRAKLKENFSQILVGIGAVLTGGISPILRALLSWAPAIAETLGVIKKAFYNAFQGAMQQAIMAINGMVASVMKAVQAFVDKVRNIIGKGIQLAVDVSVPSLASFAKMAAILEAGMEMLQAALNGGGGGSKGGKKIKGRPQLGGGGSGVGGPGLSEGTHGFVKVPSGYPNDSYPMRVESGEEVAVIPRGGASPLGKGGGMGGNFILNLTYAPAFSTADQSELLSNLVPLLNQWYRQRLAS